MKRLIINGDDFGMNEHCSRAIAQALSEGLITDTTMMANGEYFDEAADLAREQGFSDKIGIHFNLTEGEPLTDAIRDLPAFVSHGRFHKQYWQHPRTLNEAERDAVYRELSAQAEKLRQAGMCITHADSHHYVHNYLHIAPIVAQVCREYGIDRIRLNRTFDTPASPRICEHRIENTWWRDNGFTTTAHFGRLSDVEDTEIPDDTEIMVHPDYAEDGELIDRSGVVDGFPVGKKLTNMFT